MVLLNSIYHENYVSIYIKINRKLNGKDSHSLLLFPRNKIISVHSFAIVGGSGGGGKIKIFRQFSYFSHTAGIRDDQDKNINEHATHTIVST